MFCITPIFSVFCIIQSPGRHEPFRDEKTFIKWQWQHSQVGVWTPTPMFGGYATNSLDRGIKYSVTYMGFSRILIINESFLF